MDRTPLATCRASAQSPRRRARFHRGRPGSTLHVPMSPATRRAPPKSSPVRKRADWTPGFLKHRTLMAAEAVLVVSLLRGVLEDWVKATDLPGYGKVLFLMAGTVGLLGGLYWIIEALTQSSVERTHALLKTFSMPYLLVHGLVFTVLFFVYAHQHHIRVW